jgi:hypothetical protein
LEKIHLIHLFVQVKDLAHHLITALVQWDTLEFNAKVIFALERTQRIPMFALKEDLVNLLTIAIVQWDTLEINVK